MELPRDGGWLFGANDVDEAVEDRASARRVVATEPRGDLSGVEEKARCLIVLILGDELSLIIDGFRVLFDGDADDTGEPFSLIFLRGQFGGREKRQNRDTGPSRESTIHCRVNLSGLRLEAIACAKAAESRTNRQFEMLTDYELGN